MATKKTRPREVVREISSQEVTQMMLSSDELPIEIRQRRDGSYFIQYPAEGWLPCPPVCDSKHRHEYQHPYTESYYVPTDLDDALEYGHRLAGQREVKVIDSKKGARDEA